KPKRWLSPLPDNVREAHDPGIYASLMNFFGGARACISQVYHGQPTKIFLATLIRAFTFSRSARDIEGLMGNTLTPSMEGSSTFGAQC
ncbi:hypothetical protein GLOTRDRAFT_41199, partial [Gloeophyllum trabeum ATCC 11539]